MSIFWSDANLAPKRQFRFEVVIPDSQLGEPLTIPSWAIKTVTKPVITVNSFAHNFMDHEFKFPGRATWGNVTITMVDPHGSTTAGAEYDMARALLGRLGDSGYLYPTDPLTAKASISKTKAGKTIGQVLIKQLDEIGSCVEQWTLVNPFLVNIDFGGTLDYSSDEFSEISIEVAYDYATLNQNIADAAPGTSPPAVP